MSRADELALVQRRARLTILAMGGGVAIYAPVLWFFIRFPERLSPTVANLALIPGLAALAGAWWGFRSLTDERLRALPNRHQGRKERSTELTPRAQALLGRVAMVGILTALPAMIGIGLRIFGAPAIDSVAFMGTSLLALTWLWLRLPRTLEAALA